MGVAKPPPPAGGDRRLEDLDVGPVDEALETGQGGLDNGLDVCLTSPVVIQAAPDDTKDESPKLICGAR